MVSLKCLKLDCGVVTTLDVRCLFAMQFPLRHLYCVILLNVCVGCLSVAVTVLVYKLYRQI